MVNGISKAQTNGSHFGRPRHTESFLQFLQNVYKLIQRIRPINPKLPILKHHEIPIVLPTLRLPLAAQLELAFAVAVVPVVAFVLDQHQFPGFGHYHKIGMSDLDVVFCRTYLV